MTNKKTLIDIKTCTHAKTKTETKTLKIVVRNNQSTVLTKTKKQAKKLKAIK